MITPEVTAEILRLFHAEKWKVETIATQLGVHHSVVERVLTSGGSTPAKSRPSMVDAYLPFIRETLEKYPRLTASRLLQMIQGRGYQGKKSRFREVIAKLRPQPAREKEAYLRLKTLPGEQAQVDWANFGKVKVGRAERVLSGFVTVLSHSRAIFLRFSFGQHMSNFLRGHVEAFCEWNGVPRVVLYDNLRSAVLRRIGKAIEFNPILLALSAHYRYEARPVSVARGNEKGRVERAIRYARESFFAARSFKDLDDLNRQAETWFRGEAMDRKWPEDPAFTVRQVFEAEQKVLLELPPDPFPADERVEVSVGKTPYVRFDCNDYSIPHELVRRTLVVLATPGEVRILDGATVVATHRRSFDRGVQIEKPEHIQALLDRKREAREHRSINSLFRAAPKTAALLERIAERGTNIGNATQVLLSLLNTYGADELDAAVTEVLARDVPHPHAVRHVLEQRRHAKGLPPALPLDLPDDPRVRDLDVKPHSLDSYDQIRKELPDDQAPACA